MESALLLSDLLLAASGVMDDVGEKPIVAKPSAVAGFIKLVTVDGEYIASIPFDTV